MRILVAKQPEAPRNALVGCRPCASRRRPKLLAPFIALFAAQFVFGLTLAAQMPTTPATPPAHHHRKPTAQKPAARSVPAPASIAQSAPDPVPCPAVAPDPAVSPAMSCIPNWPANKKPAEASVVWDSHGLFIQAYNSSLDQILNDVSLKTGARVQGMGADERIFGTYGPGPARDVLSDLLDGSGYNVLLVGDLGQGTPRRIVLSGRPTGPPPPVQSTQEADQEPMTTPEPMQTGPYSQPDMPGSVPPPPVPARSPQLMMQQQQLMEQRQRQMQQQQNIPQNPQ